MGQRPFANIFLFPSGGCCALGGTGATGPLSLAQVQQLSPLPMALSPAIGAETQRSLAIVVGCGLIAATLLAVVVLPVFCLLINDRYVAAPRPDGRPVSGNNLS